MIPIEAGISATPYCHFPIITRYHTHRSWGRDRVTGAKQRSAQGNTSILQNRPGVPAHGGDDTWDTHGCDDTWDAQSCDDTRDAHSAQSSHVLMRARVRPGVRPCLHGKLHHPDSTRLPVPVRVRGPGVGSGPSSTRCGGCGGCGDIRPCCDFDDVLLCNRSRGCAWHLAGRPVLR